MNFSCWFSSILPWFCTVFFSRRRIGSLEATVSLLVSFLQCLSFIRIYWKKCLLSPAVVWYFCTHVSNGSSRTGRPNTSHCVGWRKRAACSSPSCSFCSACWKLGGRAFATAKRCNKRCSGGYGKHLFQHFRWQAWRVAVPSRVLDVKISEGLCNTKKLLPCVSSEKRFRGA